MTVTKTARGALTVLFLGLLGIACATGGRGSDRPDLASLRRDARAAEQARDLSGAELLWRTILEDHPGSDAEPEALLSMARLLGARGGCAAALPYWRRFAEAHGRHPRRPAVLEEIASCPEATDEDAGGALAGDTLDPFEAAFAQAGAADRAAIAEKGWRAARLRQDGVAEVRWLMRRAELAGWPDSERAERFQEALDGVRFVEVRRLLESDVKLPAALRAEAIHKLGRVQLHVGDLAGATRSLQSYLQDSAARPEGRASAQRLLQRIAQRREVRPERVGLLLPLTGRHRAYGRTALKVVQAVFSSETEFGAGLELVVADTKSDAATAARAVDDLVLGEQVGVILGPVFSYEAEAAAVRAQAMGVPMLTISRSEVLDRMGPFIFQNAVSNEAQVEALVAHAVERMGLKRFAILHPRHPYGEELKNHFWDAVTKRGGEIRGVESYLTSATTFAAQVKRLVARDALNLRSDYRRALEACDAQRDAYRKARCRSRVGQSIPPIVDFDAIFVPDYARTISMVSAALAFEDVIVETHPRRLERIEKTLGRKVKPVTLLGANGWNSTALLERAGRNVENAVFTDAFSAGSQLPRVARFVEAFQRAHRRPPRLYPDALIHDSARMLRTIHKQSRPSSREAWRTAIRSIKGFPGVTGATSFAGSNQAQRPIKILQVKNGEIVEVPPRPSSARG